MTVTEFTILVSLLVLGGCVAVSVHDETPLDPIAVESLSVFHELEDKIEPLEQISEKTGASLAWGESYWLLPYVSMFEGTGDTRYLESVMVRCDEVLKIRDDRRGIVDEIRGRVVPAWSSTNYTKGKAYSWIVHAGMITFPIARCAYLIQRDPELREAYGDKAARYIEALEETVQGFDDAWREDAVSGEGWYHGDYLERGLPLNQQNALGRTLVALWLATGDDAYKAKAEKLGRFLKNRLRREGKCYVWTYWPDGERVEDISHAAINVDFAFNCFRAGIVFTEEDMLLFVETLKACKRDGEGFAGAVDGQGDLKRSHAMAYWGHLGFVAPEVRTALHSFFRENLSGNVQAGLANAAYLVETGNPLRRDTPALPEE